MSRNMCFQETCDPDPTTLHYAPFGEGIQVVVIKIAGRAGKLLNVSNTDSVSPAVFCPVERIINNVHQGLVILIGRNY